jgi:UrcA family protein
MRAHLTPLLAAAAMTALALPAAAQQVYYVADGPYVDEVVVTPTYRYRDGPNRLSQRVSYADLDLTTRAGQEVLRLRIKDTARSICRTLGEGPGNGGPLLPSCETQAIRDARPQVRRAVRYAFANPPAYAYNDIGDAYAWNTRVWP